MTNSSEDFDIVIVGGGLAGGLAAAALSNAGFSCALVDAAAPSAMTNTAFDGRTTAISYASARVFRHLGLWRAIEDHAEPIRDILVTDGRADTSIRKGSVSPFSIHFDSRELGPDTPLGYIVENRLIRMALYDAIGADKNISLIAPAKAGAPDYGAGAAHLNLDDGRQLKGQLILAADGRGSALRKTAGLKTNDWAYRQTGIVVTVAHAQDHQGVAQELFLPAGPFAILPMTPIIEEGAVKAYRSSLVWTEKDDAASAYLQLPEDELLLEISNRFGSYLGDLSLAGPVWSYPLAFTLAQSYIAPRLALIGDAAHAIHPIAGQGFNLGVKDIAALVDVLTEARDVGLDIGALTALEKYQRWRRFDSASLALGTDLLNRLFSNDFGPLRLARDIGMGAVGRIKPLRNFFMRQAGADLGALPSLMTEKGLAAQQ